MAPMVTPMAMESATERMEQRMPTLKASSMRLAIVSRQHANRQQSI